MYSLRIAILQSYGGNGKRIAWAIAPTPFLAKVFGVAEAGILALFLVMAKITVAGQRRTSTGFPH